MPHEAPQPPPLERNEKSLKEIHEEARRDLDRLKEKWTSPGNLRHAEAICNSPHGQQFARLADVWLHRFDSTAYQPSSDLEFSADQLRELLHRAGGTFPGEDFNLNRAFREIISSAKRGRNDTGSVLTLLLQKLIDTKNQTTVKMQRELMR